MEAIHAEAASEVGLQVVVPLPRQHWLLYGVLRVYGGDECGTWKPWHQPRSWLPRHDGIDAPSSVVPSSPIH